MAMASVSGPMSWTCFLMTMPTPATISMAPIHARARSSSWIEKISRRSMAMRRAAVGGSIAPASRAAITSGSNESTERLDHVRRGEPDLRGHHHQIHVPPGRMIFRRGQLIRIADDEPHRVRPPHHETGTQNVERKAVAGEDAQRRAERHEQPGDHEERRDHVRRSTNSEGDGECSAAAGEIAFDVGEVLRRGGA